MKKLILTLGALSTLVLGACSSSSNSHKDSVVPATEEVRPLLSCDETSTSDSTFSSFSSIVAGQPVKSSSPMASQIVLIYFQKGEDTMICSGSLLPGNVVLSAGHCVADSPGQMLIIFSTNLDSITDANASQFVRKVDTFQVNPSYLGSTDNRDDDLSMIHFQGTTPTGYVPFAVPTGSANYSCEDTLIMAGYGITNYGKKDSGILRTTTLPITRAYRDSDAPGSFMLDQHDTGVCSGDSGSPLMIEKSDSSLEIIGVASTVVRSATDPVALACDEQATFVDLSQQMSWFNSTYVLLRDNK